MTDSQSSSPPKNHYEVISPPTNLSQKALSGKSEFGADLKAIKRAEKAMEVLSEQFSDWMDQELEQLDLCRQQVKASNFMSQDVDDLYRCSHDIRGQAETFGFPLAGSFCQSLCFLIDNIPDTSRLPALLIDQHVDSVKAVVRSNITSKDDKKSLELLKKLSEVTIEFIKHETQLAEKSDAEAPEPETAELDI